MSSSPIKRIASALRRHDAKQLIPLFFKNLRHLVVSGLRPDKHQVSEFDLSLHTETESIREIGSLDIQSTNAKHAVRYQPSPVDSVLAAISDLSIDHSRFAFIDFGCGKGRVLMLAAQYPYKSVSGIEFSEELAGIARTNLKTAGLPVRAGQSIEVHCADFTEYDLPPEPLVCYFYNPCRRPVMQIIADKIEMSLRELPRDAIIVYLDPVHRELFDASDRWNLVVDNNSWVTFESRSVRK